RPAVASALFVVGDAYLVVLRNLPGHATESRVVPFLPPAQPVERAINPRRPLHHLRRGSRRRQEHILGLVPVDASVLPREPPSPDGAEEPEPVPLNRPANRRRLVEELLCLARRSETALFQSVVDVVAFQLVVRVQAREDRFEGVAPV